MVIAEQDTSEAIESGETFLARMAALASIIETSGAEGDRIGALPANLVDALHEARMFRLLLPKAYGGAELSPPEFFQVIEAAAKLDGSTAWCLCQGNGCAMSAAYVAPDVANEIWGEDPRGVLAWGPGRPPCGPMARTTGSAANARSPVARTTPPGAASTAFWSTTRASRSGTGAARA